MAEDREAFRDLLDRLGQPYAPALHRRGGDAGGTRGSSREALETIGLPAIVRPAFTLGGTGGGIVETEAAYRERDPRRPAGEPDRPGHGRAVPRRLAGDRVRGHARRRRHVHRGLLDGERRPARRPHRRLDRRGAVQTLTDPVHQRLRSAALAIIRGLGVEGGCNVQFALSPDSTEYAVIEVNPRVCRCSALASKATGYPIARVAAQIAVGRRLAEIPNVVTGTTVAAFEPALDYVVVKLPRFPFDKFPSADRTLGSQMKATGEVMAIDRTFGSALNKALRGLEQAGVGPLAEDPSWTPTFDYLAGVYAGDPDADEPIRWVDEAGQACESTRHAQRTAAPIVLRRFLEPSDSRLWRLLGLLRRGVPEAVDRRGDRASRRGSSPRWAGTSRWRPRSRATGARLADPDGRRGGDAPRDGQARRVRRPRAGRPGRHDRGRSSGRPGSRSACGPGYAMVDTCAAEFAAETPYFYSTYAAAGSAPEAPPVARPAALVIGSGPVRIGQGIEFDYCAVQAADTLRRRGWRR